MKRKETFDPIASFRPPEPGAVRPEMPYHLRRQLDALRQKQKRRHKIRKPKQQGAFPTGMERWAYVIIGCNEGNCCFQRLPQCEWICVSAPPDLKWVQGMKEHRVRRLALRENGVFRWSKDQTISEVSAASTLPTKIHTSPSQDVGKSLTPSMVSGPVITPGRTQTLGPL